MTKWTKKVERGSEVEKSKKVGREKVKWEGIKRKCERNENEKVRRESIRCKWRENVSW